MGPFKEEAARGTWTGRMGGYGARDGVNTPLLTGCMCTRRRRGTEGGEKKQVGIGDEVKQAFC